MPFPAFAAPLIGGALGALGGARGQKKTTTNQYGYTGYDPRLYEYGGPERQEFRGLQSDLVRGLLGSMPGYGGYWGGGPGGGGGGFGMDFSGGGGGSATASIPDLNAAIYQLAAPGDWLSGVQSQGRERLSSATEDATRLMRDQMIRSGADTSSPAFLAQMGGLRRGQEENLANMVRETNLAWTLPAAERQAGARAQKAQLETGVSELNAQLAEEAARRRMMGTQFGANFGRQGYGMLFDMLSRMISPSAGQEFRQTSGKQIDRSGGGLMGGILGGLGGLGTGLDINRLFGIGKKKGQGGGDWGYPSWQPASTDEPWWGMAPPQ